ncbi:MAG: CoA transferase, partial [Deltaproteobacteria bacterium]|nr:CoA transferase [Deltaproteobacteria bacterium]
RLSELPLKHIRVIDLSTVVAAPFAATLLGDMGAEVIKIENPSMPDALRAWGVIREKGIQPFWSVIGRNKYPVTLNLKSQEGKQIFEKLIEITDVLIENMRPGILDKLGFDSDTLLELNPGLIIGKISGYGQTGPYSHRPGFGTLAEGYSGYTYLNAQPEGVPINPPMALADYIAGLHLAFALLIALRGQKRGHAGGQVIDVSLYEPLFGLLGPDFLSYYLTGEIPQPKGNELSYTAPRNSYKTRDGKWVALSCSAQKPFERLMQCIGHPEMIKDPRFSTNESRIQPQNRKILNQVISQWIGNHDARDVLEICDRLDITVGPIASMKDIDEDRHYTERGSIIEIEDPLTGIALKMPNLAFRMLGTPGQIRFPGLPHGSANMAIYGELLGYSTEQIEALREKNVI